MREADLSPRPQTCKGDLAVDNVKNAILYLPSIGMSIPIVLFLSAANEFINGPGNPIINFLINVPMIAIISYGTSALNCRPCVTNAPQHVCLRNGDISENFRHPARSDWCPEGKRLTCHILANPHGKFPHPLTVRMADICAFIVPRQS